MQPCWSPDGRSVAWVTWDHPRMPWDGSELWVASLELEDGRLPRLAGEPNRIAGGDDTAIFQPSFTPDGRAIVYVTDESGWGRLAIRDLATGEIRDAGVDAAELG